MDVADQTTRLSRFTSKVRQSSRVCEEKYHASKETINQVRERRPNPVKLYDPSEFHIINHPSHLSHVDNPSGCMIVLAGTAAASSMQPMNQVIIFPKPMKQYILPMNIIVQFFSEATENLFIKYILNF